MDARLILLALAFCGAAQAFDHGPWDSLLKRHVVVARDGKASQVRYAGMAKDREALRGYLGGLSRVGEAEFQAWPKDERMAFLVNAYNAFTIEKVLTRYPDIGSIRDFGRFFGNPFKDEFFSLLGRKSSLDRIEHDILRREYREPRIHYALNCAAVSCPMLREEAYVAARLERQLDEQAVRFLSDRSRNRVAGGRLEVSKIFDWFKEDFEPREAYFARYASVLGFTGGVPPLSFLDYDWSLNDFRSSSPR